MRQSSTAGRIVDAINAGMRAGGDEDDWDASEYAEARRLMMDAGCVWDFAGWRHVRDMLDFTGRLGGVDLR
jgi:hypothetical protein